MYFEKIKHPQENKTNLTAPSLQDKCKDGAAFLCKLLFSEVKVLQGGRIRTMGIAPRAGATLR